MPSNNRVTELRTHVTWAGFFVCLFVCFFLFFLLFLGGGVTVRVCSMLNVICRPFKKN